MIATEPCQLQWDHRLGGQRRLAFITRYELMQIPPEIRQCVAFVGCKRKSGMEVRGTAFFVATPVPDSQRVVVCAVTAWHVIDGVQKLGIDGNSYLRLNLRGHGAEYASLPVSLWLRHPDNQVDLAVAPIELDWTQVNHRFLSTQLFLTDSDIHDQEIGPGDELYFPGLFAKRPGESENIPIIRTGTIAAMPGEPIETDYGRFRAYLTEARSIGGFSGSPVFVHYGPFRQKGGKTQFGNSVVFHLLGVVHGHYGLPDILDIADEEERDHSLAAARDTRRLNMGIAIVIPVDEIRVALDHPELVAIRERVAEKYRAEKSQNLPEAD